MKAMTLRLPDDVYERLRTEAFQKRVSITSLILKALSTESEVYPSPINPPKPGNEESETTSEDVTAGWADWFERNSSHVGGRPVFTADEVAAILRGPKLWGASAGSPRPVEPEGQA